MCIFSSWSPRVLISSVISSSRITYFVHCSMCLSPYYLLLTHDVISRLTLANFFSKLSAMLAITVIECQVVCTMSFASIDISQCVSKRKDLVIAISIFLNFSPSGMWSNVVVGRSNRYGWCEARLSQWCDRKTQSSLKKKGYGLLLDHV
jgi:hypothetical protein